MLNVLIGQQMLAHAQDNMNPFILRMFEVTFSPGVAHTFFLSKKIAFMKKKKKKKKKRVKDFCAITASCSMIKISHAN